MASTDTHPVPPQPAEDFYGRPTHPRQGQGSAPHEDPTPQRSREDEEEEDERKPRRELTEADEKGVRPRTEEDDSDTRHASGVHPYDPRERAPGASLDEMPDGDGPRSDAGTNPVSDVYRYGHPDRMPDRER
ncbi:hypothetical protein [Corallococcus sp. AS-1-6]|uniref:hypothetical protein n=1 Tax=Corallococcus sp. AS-1-6 TaxID=2874599 RepID=UPI001CBF2EA5|nr:hypothetical protein [Corallococcus sp. AS-1-6]MBZ4375135.1 hypothetical protein [Corallococcus sp. AS-1-6]